MELASYLQKNPKKYLLFDFDETLFHLLLPWKIFKTKLRLELRRLDPTLNFQTKEIFVLMNQAMAKHGKAAKKIIYSWGERFENDYLEGAPPNSKLISFIKSFKDKYSFYIWSSNMKKTIISMLRRNHLENLFQKIISREMVDLIKPYPDGFFQIFNPKIHKRADFLMFGDSYNDEKAAERVGIDYFKVKFKSPESAIRE